MELSNAILRIFDVRAKDGKVDILRQKLSDTSVDVVKGEPGNLGYFFGESVSSEGNDLVFISVWKDLQSVQSKFGDQWQHSFLPPGYEALIESCSVRHVRCNGQLLD